MQIQVDNSFIRDAKKAPKNIQKLIPQLIESIRQAETAANIPKAKKMSGYKNAYRIKVDDYRIGFYQEDGIIILSRLLARKEVYKFFPA